MAAPYATDLFLLHEPDLSKDDERFLSALASGLRAKDLRVACPLLDLEPGEDREAWIASALRDSAWTVVVRTRAATPAFRALVNRAAAWQQAEPAMARVIPVRRPKAPQNEEALSGLEVLVAVVEGAGGAAEVVTKLASVADSKGVRALRRGTQRVVVVGDSQEMGPELDAALAAARGLRGRVWQAERVCIREMDAPARVAAADVAVVLLGASTAGQAGADVLAGAVEHHNPVLMAIEDVPRARWKTWPDDRARADGLRDRILDELGGLAFHEPSELRALLTPALIALVDRLDPPQGEAAGGLTEGERGYLLRCWPAWREGRHKDLAEARGRGLCDLRRESLYVHLRCDDAVAEPGGAIRLRAELRQDDDQDDEKKAPPAFLDQRLTLPAQRHIAVLGEAGTGKTVLLQHLATVLGAEVDPTLAMPIAGEEPLHHLDLGALAGPDGAPPLPVLFEARHLVPHLTGRSPYQAVRHHLAGLLDLPEKQVEERLFAGRYLLLVDSLDEVPGEHRARVLGALTELAREPRSRARLILTSRPLAHTGIELGAPLQVTRIAPLDPDRQAAMVGRWCAAQAYDRDRASLLSQALQSLGGQFEQSAADGLLPHQNPLLLTCICIVFDNGDRLPDNRAALYDRMVDILTRAKLPEPQPGAPPRDLEKPESRLRALKSLMLEMQRAGETALPFAAARDRIARDLGLHGQDSRAERALLDLANSTGLVRVEADTGGLRPWHRSFQEYLAALALVDDRDVTVLTNELCRDGGEALDPGWTGCLQFLTATIGDRDRAEAYIRALLVQSEGPPDREARLLALAAAGVAEYRLERFQGSAVPSEVVARIHQRFAAAGETWPWRDRLAALDGLGRLGDPRFPDPRQDGQTGWVFVKGRRALLGETEDPREVEVPDLWVRAWPVLVSELRAFVEEGGYSDRAWWTEGQGQSERKPEDWADQVRHPNRPAVGLSWFTARAFARWAMNNARPWLLPGPGRLDLLTSDQWEAVARGPGSLEQTEYPWGREQLGRAETARACHNWESRGSGPFRSAQPVGGFPLGDKSSYGAVLHDLAGNVWEWCASEDGGGDCQHVDNRSDAARVLRGGSWDFVPWFLRCAFRSRLDPRSGLGSIGFRLCVSVPPSRSLSLEP